MEIGSPGLTEQRSSFSERQSMACRDKRSALLHYCSADTYRAPWLRPGKTATVSSVVKNCGQTGEIFLNELKELRV